jgi:hypothetical protein
MDRNQAGIKRREEEVCKFVPINIVERGGWPCGIEDGRIAGQKMFFFIETFIQHTWEKKTTLNSSGLKSTH